MPQSAHVRRPASVAVLAARDQFDYRGSGWGHAGGEGAPADPHGGTNSWISSSTTVATATHTTVRTGPTPG
jgi:hypothetical protein